MRIVFVIVIAVVCWVDGAGQLPALKINDTSKNAQYRNNWMNNLFEMGVETKNDSLYVKEEVIKLFTDSVYRNSVYPQQYKWPRAIALLKQMELKKAFWHLINLYGSDSASNSYVVGTFIAYDSIMPMDKLLLSAYYTYAFADPRVSRVVNNKPDIFRPDLLEQGLNRVKEIIEYVWYYREKRLTGK
jgi:hypothetical protein